MVGRSVLGSDRMVALGGTLQHMLNSRSERNEGILVGDDDKGCGK